MCIVNIFLSVIPDLIGDPDPLNKKENLDSRFRGNDKREKKIKIMRYRFRIR